jgi:hypothetical protein
MIPLDKRLHACVGFALALPLALAGLPAEGLCLALIVGCLKELWDAYHPLTHTADFWDFAATTLGGLFGAVVGWLV